MTTALGLAVVALLVGATAFFVAAEFAIVASDRNRLEARAAAGSRSARTALMVHRRLSFHLSGAQLGLTVVSLVLGFVAEPTLARVIEPLVEPIAGGATRGVSVVIALAIATVLSMVVGELMPKNLVMAHPEASAVRLARPLHLFSVALSPLIKVSNGTANRLVRALGVEPQEELESLHTLDDLASIVRSAGVEGTLAPDRAGLLARSIRFHDKSAADALVPRVEVEAVSVEDSLAGLVEASLRTGHSRFPVIRADLDDVVGVVHVKDVLQVPAGERAATAVAAVMADPVAVPETRLLEDLFGDLRDAGSHLAVVVDEYGGTAGIVTLEDLLEELVGEIDDEYDVPTTASWAEPGDTGWVVAGSLHPDEVEEACGFVVPDGDYETLAGFLLDRLGRIPTPGEQVEHDGWALTVREMDHLRIATVAVTAPEVASGDDGEQGS